MPVLANEKQSDALRLINGGAVVMLDGIDGVGKTTQIELLKASLAKKYPNRVHTTRIVGGSEIGELLRVALLSNVQRPVKTDLYINLAMHEALAVALEGHRESDEIVLIDRSSLAIAAYQIYGDRLEPSLGWRAVDQSIELLRPDCLIVYNASLSVARNRMDARKLHSDYFESRDNSYFKRVQSGYLEAAQRY